MRERRGQILNLDADYAAFSRDNIRHQANQYFDATETERLAPRVIFAFKARRRLPVSGLKLDFEQPLPFGRLSVGGKIEPDRLR